MTTAVAVLVFVIVFGVVFWGRVLEAREVAVFNRKWDGHDIHWDDARDQWRHDGTCPCGNGPFAIHARTTVPSGVCHCGASMAEHSAWDNHSPVDMAD